MRFKYSFQVPEEEKQKYAKAYIWNAPISRKHAVEICRAVRGMRLLEAIQYLEDVVKMKRPVPFARYNRGVPHRHELAGPVKSGRYPVKAASYILRLLKDVLANAKYKGLDEQKLRIVHIAAHKGTSFYKYRLKHVYIRPMRKKLAHVEVVVKEEGQ
ncbi:MAG: 50S ribosomal protein L22 [bacterium]|nr:50S ribosomal protein L22 [bacterium]